MKLKICSSCQKECYLWKSIPPLCKSCALKNATQIGNYTITTKTAVADTIEFIKDLKKDIKPNGKRKAKRINPISEKQKERLKRYRINRDEYFEENPICQFPDCNSRDITLHHMAGKIGDLLFDKRWFKSLCFTHHRFVEENPLESQKLGLSKKRLDK